MERNEQETIILINAGDMEEGYFRFSTTNEQTFNKVAKRIDGDFYEPVYISTDIKGKSFCWICKIPKKYFSKRTFGIGKPKVITESQKEAARQMGLRAQEARRKASLEH